MLRTSQGMLRCDTPLQQGKSHTFWSWQAWAQHDAIKKASQAGRFVSDLTCFGALPSRLLKPPSSLPNKLCLGLH